NIMLANNICDRQEDMANGRHTLVSYIGEKKALRLFGISQGLILVVLFLEMMAGLFPWTGAIVFLSAPILYKNTKRLIEKPSKEKTFVFSVKNFVLVASLMTLALIGALLW
ncbi:MAG TPA: prenyltransferase, partial [Clostridia bacterium]|nr:prenyltransferase [Clostridia bacterium]